MPHLDDWLIQLCQVGSVALFGPLVTGVIARLEAVVQQRRGPRLLQPYYDIAKLFRKETVLPEGAGPVFRLAPYVAFAGYLTVPLLIPVLTTFPLKLGYMGDILGGGFVLGLASFAVSLAAIDSGSPFAQLGSSRLRSFGALGEPTIIFVIFTVALITHTDLPYAMVATLKSSTVEFVRPAHLLAAAAFFMVILSETGRVPLENHGSTLEFGMIEEARTLEHSGPGFALLRWGSSMKQLILYVIFANVLVVPWGLSVDNRLDHVLIAMGLLLAKAIGVGVAIAIVEASYAKLRLYKIPEFTVASFLLAVLAVITFVFEREFGGRLTVFGGFSSVIAVLVLLVGFALLRSQDVWEQLRLYGFSSGLVAVLAFAAAATSGSHDLYALGAVTIAFKALAIPIGIGYVIRSLDIDTQVPSVVRVPTAFLLGIALASFAFLALARLPLSHTTPLPLSALAVSVSVVLVGFLLMILRPHAPSQLLGFLVIENGVTLASLVVAPSFPLILALLLLFDVLGGVLVFGVLVQYFGLQRLAVTTDILDRLKG
jgi:formate hydrogenlyase subunit 4/hydrogenase-4 membrane subunit HyfE